MSYAGFPPNLNNRVVRTLYLAGKVCYSHDGKRHHASRSYKQYVSMSSLCKFLARVEIVQLVIRIVRLKFASIRVFGLTLYVIYLPTSPHSHLV